MASRGPDDKQGKGVMTMNSEIEDGIAMVAGKSLGGSTGLVCPVCADDEDDFIVEDPDDDETIDDFDGDEDEDLLEEVDDDFDDEDDLDDDEI